MELANSPWELILPLAALLSRWNQRPATNTVKYRRCNTQAVAIHLQVNIFCEKTVTQLYLQNKFLGACQQIALAVLTALVALALAFG